MMTQRAKWIRLSPNRPASVEGKARAAMKISRCTQLKDGGTGVRTFIPYALPAMFDIPSPLRLAVFRSQNSIGIAMGRQHSAPGFAFRPSKMTRICEIFLKSRSVRNNPDAKRVLSQMREAPIGQGL